MNILQQIAVLLGAKLTKVYENITASNKSIEAETARAKASESLLDTNIKNETARAQNEESRIEIKAVDFVAKEEIRATNAEKANSDAILAVDTAYKTADIALDEKKVDKVEGKQLSTENYTSLDMTKVGYLENFVIGNWFEKDSSSQEVYLTSTRKNPVTGGTINNSTTPPLVTGTHNGFMSPSQKLVLDNLLSGNSALSVFGTPSQTWQLNSVSGPKIKNSGGTFELRNSADSAYADLTVNSLTIKGNVTQEGGSFITQAETVSAKDNAILLNSGETGAGVTKGTAGIEVDRGTLPKYKFIFDESDDRFKVGSEADLWSVLLRDNESDLTNGGILTWDSSTKRAKTAFNIDDLSTKYLPLSGGRLTGSLILPKNEDDAAQTGTFKGLFGEPGWLSTTGNMNTDMLLGYAQDAVYLGNDAASLTMMGSAILLMAGEGISFQSAADISISGYTDLFITSGQNTTLRADTKLILDSPSIVDKNNNKFWTAGNDGVGSGLDADLLDGKQGSEYALKSELGSKSSLITPQIADENLAVPSEENSTMVFKVTSTSSVGNDGFIWANRWGGNYATQLFIDVDSTNIISLRQRDSVGIWGKWERLVLASELPNNYLPLSAGNGKPLTGPLYIAGYNSNGPAGYNIHLNVGSNSIQDSGIESNATNISVGFGAHSNGSAYFWIGGASKDSKDYYASVDKSSRVMNFINRPQYNNTNLATISDIPSLSGYSKSILSAGTTYSPNSSGVIDLSSEFFSAKVPRTAKTFLAAPTGSNGVSSFRAIVVDDLPTIPYSKISGTPTIPSLSGGAGATAGQYVSGVTVSGHTVTVTKAALPSIPTTLPASDVYAWAKTSTKPTYTASEVGAASSGHTHESLNNSLRVNGLLIAYNYTISGSKASITMDKLGNGSYGIGPNGTSMNIRYGTTTSVTDGTWISDPITHIFDGPVYANISQLVATQSWVQSQGYKTTDLNYYPTGITWTTATGEGPSIKITGTGMSTINAIIPSASASQSGTVHCGVQTFAGAKTFSAYVTCSAGAGTSSDIRLKECINRLYDAEEVLSSLSGYRYKMKETGLSYAGLIAQEVQKVLPEAVREDQDGFLTVDTYPIVAALVEANNAKSDRINTLENRLKILEDKVNSILLS